MTLVRAIFIRLILLAQIIPIATRSDVMLCVHPDGRLLLESVSLLCCTPLEAPRCEKNLSDKNPSDKNHDKNQHHCDEIEFPCNQENETPCHDCKDYPLHSFEPQDNPRKNRRLYRVRGSAGFAAFILENGIPAYTQQTALKAIIRPLELPPTGPPSHLKTVILLL